jgi:hypothetical protein
MKIKSLKFTLETGVLLKRGRMLWTQVKHKDGAKALAEFDTKEQARQYIRNHLPVEYVRIVNPTGKIEMTNNC